MKLAAAIFVKTPHLSPVKTRLAATLGRAATEHFFIWPDRLPPPC
ncbi:MAG: hypothetical protein R3E95_23310 [Thiolinea sp.]